MSDPAEIIYEAVTEICATFSQRPQHHLDRLTLLTYPQGEWVELIEVIGAHTTLAKRLRGLNDKGVDLYAIHNTTPDGTWSLVSFYCGLIDAMPATALLRKSAHEQEERH
jgi:hypothetical protein